ncbi:hypothetical protein PILCRDRAFT_821097 [Piloderma croceum F 1598]|uniref:Uncharacterized protein n=1 Tax=Piloderma croceum (strain F 1598) TaxID=765440 RepID=A0A0C3FRJ9_PILCF|nr:hypothetical protein PILCRDRAFT_821097 [Piloderma croceum F 1598]
MGRQQFAIAPLPAGTFVSLAYGIFAALSALIAMNRDCQGILIEPLLFADQPPANHLLALCRPCASIGWTEI